MTGIGRHMLRGSAWMIGFRWISRFIGFVSTAILARLLTPEDFGVLATGTLVIGLLDVCLDLGTFQLLIRMQDPEHRDYDTAWTIVFVQSVILAAGLYVAAPWAAVYFNEPRTESVMRWLALSSVISGLVNVGTVDFRKQLDFAKDVRFQVITRLARFVITVSLAFALRSYWALVFGVIGGAVARVFVSYVMHPFRPRPSLASWRRFLAFSLWITPGNVANYLNSRLDTFIVGAVASTTTFGAYNVASELSKMVTNEVVVPAQRALFPAFARIASDAEALRNSFLYMLRVIALVCFALGVGLSVVSHDFVLVVLGDQWRFAIPLMRWFALTGVFWAYGFVMSYHIFVVTGHERVTFYLYWARLAVAAPVLLYVATHYNIQAMAATTTFVSIGYVVLTAACVRVAIPVSAGTALGVLLRPALASIAMALVVHALRGTAGARPVISLAWDVGVGALVYVVAIYGSWWLAGRPLGPESTVIDYVGRRMGRGSR